MDAGEYFDRTEFVAYFRDETEELLRAIDDALLRLEEQSGTEPDSDLINGLFRALHTVKGSAAMLEFTDVSTLAHRLENACDLVRKERMPIPGTCVALLFEGRDLLTALVAAAVGGESAPSEAVAAFLARLEGFEPAYRSAPAAACASEADRAVVTPSAPTPAPVQPAAPPSETVRVDISRLDGLLNLVGELVISRTRISEIATTLAQTVALDRQAAAAPLARELAERAATLARTTSEIQESIMKVRMVAIGTVFERFPRMVRDLARSSGKEVALSVSGAETELDKTIVDRIGEPLMHLVRNCVDHGIEPAHAREANGKEPAGRLSLAAYHEGNQVIVEIADDGGGIDLERVRARGVKSGLLREHDRPSDREIIELIFTPGFSTAATVTDVSGRGVGMDVVKNAILSLKGVLDVQTAPGRGTTFTIKLPLTLAIIKALLVRVAGELYAIPLDAITETLRVPARDVHRIGGGEVLNVRDGLVPLVRLCAFFQAPGDPQPDKMLTIVIAQLHGRRVGLVVDSLLREQEIVIKPIAGVLGRVPGISGATILGNGSIALIIDVHSLVAAAHANGRAHAEFAAGAA